MDKKRKTLISAMALSLAAALTLGGCGGGNKPAGSASKNPKDTLVIGMFNAPETLNPLNNPGIAGQYTLRFMYDTLLGMPKVNSFTPHLADSIDTTDNRAYTIHLNKDAKWSDGKPVTADDVIFTLNTIANPKVETSKGIDISMLEGVSDSGKLERGEMIPLLSKVDDKTVTFYTKRPVDPYYVKSMLGFEVFILPKHVFEKIPPEKVGLPDTEMKAEVTSGPYLFREYKLGDHVELSANEHYYRGSPKLKKIFLRITGGNQIVAELKSGSIQMAASGGIGNVPLKELDILKQDEKLSVKTMPSLSAQFLQMNNEDPAFNVHFRRAVTMAINRRRMVDELYKGTAKIIPTLYTMGSPVYNSFVSPLPYDLEKAKNELKESGFDTSRELTIQVPLGNVQREQSADFIQQNLTELGLKVKLEKMDFTKVLSNAKKGSYELLLLGYALTPDPDYRIYFAPRSASNFGKVNDKELLSMMDKAANMTKFDDRRKAYGKIQTYLRDNQFMTTLYEADQIMVQNKDLEGGTKDFWEGSLDDVHLWHFK